MFGTLLQVLFLVAPILAASQYDFTFEKLVVDPKTNPIVKMDVSVEKKNGTLFSVSGSVEQLVELDDSYDIKLSLFFSSDNPNNLQNLATLPKVGACVLMKTLYKEFLYDSLTKACENAPKPETCPLPAALYVLNEMELDLNKFTDYFLPGYYEFKVQVYKGRFLQVQVSLFGNAKAVV